MSTAATSIMERYEDAKRSMPPSGGGGCHVAMLGIANLGALAGLTPERVVRDIRDHVHGTRHVTDSEIRDAVRKAFDECKRSAWRTCTPARPVRPAFNPGKMLRGILAKGDGATEAELWEESPYCLDREPEYDPVLLRLLYAPEVFLFMGSRYDTGGEHVRTSADWLKAIEAGADVPEHIIPNPMTGMIGKTKEGKDSYRADACVSQFCFAVLEFDQTPEPLREPGRPVEAWPRDAQAAFWAGCLAFHWPIAALIDSGGKSIHAWLVVDAKDSAEWTEKVEGEIFARFLVPCGVDSSCRNESRLSRMPGHFRSEKSRWQKILYLNPDAGKGAA